MREYTEKLLEKLRESTAAVLPIAGIVLVLCFALVPVPSGILLCFLAGAVNSPPPRPFPTRSCS